MARDIVEATMESAGKWDKEVKEQAEKWDKEVEENAKNFNEG
jgi:hypothetical protein